MVKYTGRFVCKDIANDKQYLADLLYAFELGDTLAGWTLGGTTVPTIAADGWLNLFDNTNLANQTSSAIYTVPNTQNLFLLVFRFKFKRDADDTSNDDVGVAVSIGGAAALLVGAVFRFRHDVNDVPCRWLNNSSVGSDASGGTVPAQNVLHDGTIVITQDRILYFIDGVLVAYRTVSNKGGCPLSATPQTDFLRGNKSVVFFVRHDAGEVSHYKFRDIKVGRLVGVGDV